MARTGYAKGLNGGHPTEQRERPARPAAKKMVGNESGCVTRHEVLCVSHASICLSMRLSIVR